MLNKSQFKTILSTYPIGEYKEHKYLEDVFENDVYILKTTKGKYILKVLRNIKVGDMKEQLELIDFLYSKGLPVVKNIKDRKGREISKHGGKWLLIQGFVEGTCEQDFDKKLVKNIAGHVGKMHKILLKSKFGVQRKKDHVYKKRNLSSIKKHGLDKIQNELFKELNERIDRSKLKKARIHSDLTNVNLLIKDNKLNAIIDWDDSDYDYLVYEIAIFLAHSCVRGKQIHRGKIKIFMKEYQKHVKLNEEEKKAIYFLMKYRLFGILNWYLKYIKSHSERKEMLERGIKRSVRRILKFEKVGVEDFLEKCF
ncbi:phosphotransferase [archaeon]|jgi:homoserine kinase type II|nr:phosphotransferase [archaeon]MBT3578155.1 phosphotransferase [archaeon]MBT6820703.1 phosphotransferase [archaeon]MBT6956707.1 phosphotransferase [archaeon]MBT7024888.1 phosphotransferase [archaeon]